LAFPIRLCLIKHISVKHCPFAWFPDHVDIRCPINMLILCEYNIKSNIQYP